LGLPAKITLGIAGGPAPRSPEHFGIAQCYNLPKGEVGLAPLKNKQTFYHHTLFHIDLANYYQLI
jgi:hypothetical protein